MFDNCPSVWFLYTIYAKIMAQIRKNKQKLPLRHHREHDARLADWIRLLPVFVRAEEPIRAGMCTWSKQAGTYKIMHVSYVFSIHGLFEHRGIII